jgi:hypothetical protein
MNPSSGATLGSSWFGHCTLLFPRHAVSLADDVTPLNTENGLRRQTARIPSRVLPPLA